MHVRSYCSCTMLHYLVCNNCVPCTITLMPVCCCGCRRHQTLSEIEADLSELPTPPASDTMPPQDQSASTGYNGTLHDASEDSAEDSSCSSTAAHTMQQQHPRGAQLIASAASEPDVWLRATNATAAAAHRHNPCRSAARRDAVPAGRGSYTAEYKDSSAQRRHSSRVRQQLFVGPHDQQPPGHLQHSHAGRAAEPQTAFIQPGSNNQHAVNAGYQRSKHQHMAGASHPRNSSKQAPTSISYSLPANDGAAVQRQHGRSGAFTQHIEVHATGNRAFRGSSPDEGSMAVDMPHYLTHGRAKQPSWRQSSTATGLHSGMPRSWQQLQQACTAAVAQEHHGASIAAKQGRGTNRSHAQWTCRNSSPSASSGSDLAGCSSHEGDESSWEEDNESLSQAQPPSVAQSHSSMLVSNQKTRTDEWQQQQQHQQHEQQQDNEQQTAGFGSQAPSSTTRYVFASSHQYVVADLASTAAEDPAATGQTAARRDVGAMPEQSPAVAQGQPQGTPSFSQLQAQLASKLQQLQAQLQEDEPAAAHEVRTGAQQKHIAASPARPPMPRPAPARRAASPMPVQQRAQHLEARVGHLHSEMSGMCRGKVAQLAAGRQWSLGGKAAV